MLQTRSVLRDGVIHPPTGLEIIVADHCNITCRQCNHGSPAIGKWHASPEDIGRDLAMLARHYQPAFLKYIGGEPLLHPDLPGILRAGRASGIASHHMLVTNGMLLDRMPAEAWPLLDEIEVSHYPAAGLSESDLARHRATAKAHGVRFTLNAYAEFRRTFTRIRNDDDALVKKSSRPANRQMSGAATGSTRARSTAARNRSMPRALREPRTSTDLCLPKAPISRRGCWRF
ncbi:radical SAM protein [Phaeovulum sp.]|uniref:radical SAM protein n=1 Tax=Phaeovulum sp. TaxID=2934796 RepID=UPI00272FF1EB|nr:radical SAM protein [Phaeovulum sp.]MDP1670227.1 hypothetical protein [Phaeovulum sp.]MDZ4120277.1 hypothetical protein [Phaeovulum sp.]